MHRLATALVLAFAYVRPTVAQSADDALVKKAHTLYDAPFSRGLISFDCEVRFDWNSHIRGFLGLVPVELIPTVDRLQSVPHRVFTDRTGATVSAQPKDPDLSQLPKAAQLEPLFRQMVVAGLNAWLPFATNVILPVPPTESTVEKTGDGYRMKLRGPGVLATLLLSPDLRLLSAVSTQPQPLRFTTDFAQGPQGFLLTGLATADTSDPANRESRFAYSYQDVQGIQLPQSITITAPKGEKWTYGLEGCRAVKGIVIEGLKVSPAP